MSFENKGSMTAAVVVTAAPDRSGNFVIEAGDDPAVVIETAWAFLNTFGGGTLVLKGAGQTWTLTTRIDSQGDHVTLISDHGLLLASTGAFGMIYVTNDDVKIDGLRMSMTTATARQEEMISFVSVQDAVVENCHLTGPDLERVAGDGYGIYFEDVLYGLIRGNYVDACQEAGIKLIQCGEDYGSGYIIIDENELYNTRRHGIMVQKSTDITIGDNISIGRNVGITKDGIHLSEDNERITITGNVCRYNGNAGICFAGVGDGGTWCVKSGTIAGNTCSENLMYGISVDTSENISIGDNTIRETAGNTYDIYISGVCQHIVIDGNTIYGASDGSRYHITVLEESDWVTIALNPHEPRDLGYGSMKAIIIESLETRLRGKLVVSQLDRMEIPSQIL